MSLVILSIGVRGMRIGYIPRQDFVNGSKGIVRQSSTNQPIGIKVGMPSLQQLCAETIVRRHDSDAITKVSGISFPLIGEDGKILNDVRVSGKELIPNLFFEQTSKGTFGFDPTCPPGTIRSVKDHVLLMAGGRGIHYTGYVKEFPNSSGPVPVLIPTNLSSNPYLEYTLKKDSNAFLYISDMKCVLDSKTSTPEYYPQGIVKFVTKKLDGTEIIQEGIWGPKDPGNPQGGWNLTGQGKIVTKKLDGTEIIQEGICGPKDPGNPQGGWNLTGQGKIVTKRLDGSKQIAEGIWGPKDPGNPQGGWYLTGQGKIVTKQSDGSQKIAEGTWEPKDPGNPQGGWYLTGQGKIVTKQSDGTEIIEEGIWGARDPGNPQGSWDLTGQGRKVTKQLDGTEKIEEGIWGAVDPGNPQGDWGLTGRALGKRKRKCSNSFRNCARTYQKF